MTRTVITEEAGSLRPSPIRSQTGGSGHYEELSVRSAFTRSVEEVTARFSFQNVRNPRCSPRLEPLVTHRLGGRNATIQQSQDRQHSDRDRV